jgi:hypothetical protein
MSHMNNESFEVILLCAPPNTYEALQLTDKPLRALPTVELGRQGVQKGLRSFS